MKSVFLFVFFVLSQEFQADRKFSVAQSWSHVVSVASVHMWCKTCLLMRAEKLRIANKSQIEESSKSVLFLVSSTTTDLKLATFTRLSVSCPGSMTRWCSSPSLCSSASSSRTRLVFKCQMIARCVLALEDNEKSIAAHLLSVTLLKLAADLTDVLFLQISVFSSFWSYRPF